MSSATDRMREERGQATVEAAFAIPVLMVLLLFLLQPGIVLYDRIVMEGAAAEACRLLSTTTGENAQTNDEYVRRRLSSIPEADAFHVHSTGCSWLIELAGDDSAATTTCTIRTELKPLPLVDIGLGALGGLNQNGNLEIEVSASAQTQPDWALASAEGTPASDIREP